jgi:hypothetical protein
MQRRANAPTRKRSSIEEGEMMSKAKLAAFAAALLLGVGSNASAQSAQAALKAPPHMTRTRLIAWCKSHPTATADCKEVRADTREIRSDRREVRSDRKELRQDIKAGDKKEAKADKKELKSDRKDLREDRRDRRGDVRDARKDAKK